MQGIIDFLDLIGTLLTSTIQFFVNLVLDIVYVVQLSVEFLASIPGYFSWLPAPVLTLVLACLSVCIILKVAGRN